MRTICFIFVTVLAMLIHAVRFYRDEATINAKHAAYNATIWLDDAKKSVFWGIIRLVADVIVAFTPDETKATV